LILLRSALAGASTHGIVVGPTIFLLIFFVFLSFIYHQEGGSMPYSSDSTSNYTNMLISTISGVIAGIVANAMPELS